MKDANTLGIPTYEADVECGMWCQGGSVKFYPTDHPHYTDIADVWVKGSDALNLVDTLRAELAELRNPDCRTCLSYGLAAGCPLARNGCVSGSMYVARWSEPMPVRLYENE